MADAAAWLVLFLYLFCSYCWLFYFVVVIVVMFVALFAALQRSTAHAQLCGNGIHPFCSLLLLHRYFFGCIFVVALLRLLWELFN